MNPVLSCARTVVFPSIAPNVTISSYTAGSVAIVRTTSTSFITGTGLKKCSPTNRCGRFVAVAISVIVSDEVLLAKIVDAGQRDRKSTRLNSSHSQISYAVFCLKKKKKQKPPNKKLTKKNKMKQHNE